MKTHTIIIKEAELVVNILALSPVHQQLTIRDRFSNEILCENVIVHATEVLANSTKTLLEPNELQLIQQAIEKELPNYNTWDEVELLPFGNSVYLFSF